MDSIWTAKGQVSEKTCPPHKVSHTNTLTIIYFYFGQVGQVFIRKENIKIK